MYRLLVCALLVLPTSAFAQDAEEAAAKAAPPATAEVEAAPADVPPPPVEEVELEEEVVIAEEEKAPEEPAKAEAHACGPDCACKHAKKATPGAATLTLASGFALSLDGYLRVNAGTFLPDRFFGIVMPSEYKRESTTTTGRNDGFGLGGARLNVRAAYGEKLYVRLGFDGALATYEDDESPVGELKTGLKDAYLRYSFAPMLSLWAGRFKPPFDVEELTARVDQMFVHRSLESRGVARHEGPHSDLFGQRDTRGFAPGRQLGVMLGGGTQGTGFTWGYAAALTNGNSGDATLNDNDLPAVWVRLHGGWGGGATHDEEGPATYGPAKGVTVGLSSFYNELATGVAPTRLRDRVVGGGLDVSARFSFFVAQGQILTAMTQPVTQADNASTIYSLGGHLQAGVLIPGTGFMPAYRFAYLDPRYVTDDVVTAGTSDQDRVMHHTIGVRWAASDLPLLFYAEYTHSAEQVGRSDHNDRVEAAMQVTFK